MTDSIAAKLRGWSALRAACSAQHTGGPGGAAVCVCGRGGGRSEACGTLGLLRDLIRYLPTETLPPEWKTAIEEWRAAFY